MATLYLIATPIGNLEDITQRALRILEEVSYIAAEDTRRTRKLLNHYKIHTPLVSYHEHNKDEKTKDILHLLTQGNVALVSDAGTPVLNDPGYELVLAAIQEGHRICPIPGANAPINALIASGLPPDTFLYIGYIPRKASMREQKLFEIAPYPFTIICLETPQRLLTTLKSMQTILGDRKIAIARELTKVHEEIFRGLISEAIAFYTENPARGEITIVIEGAANNKRAAKKWDQAHLLETIRDELSKGLSPSKIAGQLASQSGWERRTIYNLITDIQNKQR